MAIKGSAFFAVLLLFLTTAELNRSSSPLRHYIRHFHAQFSHPLLPDKTYKYFNQTRTLTSPIASRSQFHWYYNQLHAKGTSTLSNDDLHNNFATTIPLLMVAIATASSHSGFLAIDTAETVPSSQDVSRTWIQTASSEQMLCAIIICLGLGYVVQQSSRFEDNIPKLIENSEKRAIVVYQPLRVHATQKPDPPLEIPYSVAGTVNDFIARSMIGNIKLFLIVNPSNDEDTAIRSENERTGCRDLVLYRSLTLPTRATHTRHENASPRVVTYLRALYDHAVARRLYKLPQMYLASVFGRCNPDALALVRCKQLKVVTMQVREVKLMKTRRSGCWDLVPYKPLSVVAPSILQVKAEAPLQVVAYLGSLYKRAIAPRVYRAPYTYLVDASGRCGSDALAMVLYVLAVKVRIQEIESFGVDDSKVAGASVVMLEEKESLDKVATVKATGSEAAQKSINECPSSVEPMLDLSKVRFSRLARRKAESLVDSKRNTKPVEVATKKVFGVIDLNVPKVEKAAAVIEKKEIVEAQQESDMEDRLCLDLGMMQARLPSSRCKNAFAMAELAIVVVRLGLDVHVPETEVEAGFDKTQGETVSVRESSDEVKVAIEEVGDAIFSTDSTEGRRVNLENHKNQNKPEMPDGFMQRRMAKQYIAMSAHMASTVAAASAKFSHTRSITKSPCAQGLSLHIRTQSSTRTCQSVDTGNECFRVRGTVTEEADVVDIRAEVVKESVHILRPLRRNNETENWASGNRSLTMKNSYSVKHSPGPIVGSHMEATISDKRIVGHIGAVMGEADSVEVQGERDYAESNVDDSVVNKVLAIDNGREEVGTITINSLTGNGIVCQKTESGRSEESLLKEDSNSDVEDRIHVLSDAPLGASLPQAENAERHECERDGMEIGFETSLPLAVFRTIDPPQADEDYWGNHYNASLSLDSSEVFRTADTSMVLNDQNKSWSSLGKSTLLMLAKDPELVAIFEKRFKNRTVLPELPYRSETLYTCSYSGSSGSLEDCSYPMDVEHSDGGAGNVSISCESKYGPGDNVDGLADIDMKDIVFTFDSKTLSDDYSWLETTDASASLKVSAKDEMVGDRDHLDSDVQMSTVKSKPVFLGINKARLEARKNGFYKSKLSKNRRSPTKSAKSSFASSYTRGTRPGYKRVKLIAGEVEDACMVDVEALDRLRNFRAEQALERRIQRSRSPAVTFTGDMIHAMERLQL